MSAASCKALLCIIGIQAQRPVSLIDRASEWMGETRRLRAASQALLSDVEASDDGNMLNAVQGIWDDHLAGRWPWPMKRDFKERLRRILWTLTE